MPKSKEKAVLTSFNSTFTNDDAIFIEYHDVLKCPWYVFLTLVHNNGIMSEIFDMRSIAKYDKDELYEWYTNREYRNIFANLPIRTDVIESLKNDYGKDYNLKKWLDDTLNYELEEIPITVEANSDLNCMKIASYITQTKNLVKKIYVYTEEYNSNIEKDIDSIFDMKANYVHGDFKEVLKNSGITNNSTFIISDIKKIVDLDDAGILEYSSVLLVERYKYNYDDDEYLYDIDSIMDRSVFKFSTIDNLNMSVDDSIMQDFGNAL